MSCATSGSEQSCFESVPCTATRERAGQIWVQCVVQHPAEPSQTQGVVVGIRIVLVPPRGQLGPDHFQDVRQCLRRRCVQPAVGHRTRSPRRSGRSAAPPSSEAAGLAETAEFRLAWAQDVQSGPALVAEPDRQAERVPAPPSVRRCVHGQSLAPTFLDEVLNGECADHALVAGGKPRGQRGAARLLRAANVSAGTAFVQRGQEMRLGPTTGRWLGSR